MVVAIPTVEYVPIVAADDYGESAVGVLARQMVEGVGGVRWFRQSQFGVAGFDVGAALCRDAEHGKPMAVGD